MAYLICDTECVGQTFLACTYTIESGKERHFWTEDLAAFKPIFAHPQATFVVFNADYDIPLLQAFYQGRSGADIKEISNAIIDGHLPLWRTLQVFGLGKPVCDWIDLMPITPGVKISLKTYAGRMHTRTMQDMPIDHEADIGNNRDLVLQYCRNDVRVTTELFHTVRHELTLREQMSKQYNIDLRSKSGAQIAQAVLCKEAGIERKQEIVIPQTVSYRAPAFLERTSLIERIEAHAFTVNQVTGAVDFPPFLKEPIALGQGVYQMGIGGLHSQHESGKHYIATDSLLITDFDVSAFYPHLQIEAGIIPDLSNGGGERFAKTHSKMVHGRTRDKKRLAVVEARIAQIEMELGE